MGELKPDQIKQLKESFSLFDKNGDGKLTISEFESVLKAMKFLSDTEVSQTVKKAADSSNTIDFANFLVVMTRHLKGEAPIEEISEAFRVFDKNNNGHMSADEFKKMMVSGLQFTAEDAEEILKEANVDNDGDFDYEAFVQKLAKSR